MKNLVRILLLLAVTLIFASSVYAEVKLDYGAAFRLRQEIWDNVVTLDTISLGTSGADRNFLRLRTQLWGKADFTPNLGAYLRLTNEAKDYVLGPYRSFKNRDIGENDPFDPDELIIDNLYADAKNIFGLPVDIRIGRQDFIGVYGEGFLLMDGTPGDGSRSFYFNAAKVNVRINPCFNFDLTYISDPKTDIYMPSMHPAVSGTTFQFVDNKKVLTASNEQAFVAYGRGKLLDNLTVEPYYVYKTEQPVSGGIDLTKLKLNTIGARVLYSVNAWKFGGEFAHQWGDYDSGKDRSANGGYIFVGRNYNNMTWKPEWDLRYVYLSGDDPNTTSKVEAWDPLFSRNPYWNELIIYTLIPETAKFGGSIPGYWTNMEILKATVKLNFNPCTNLALAYQYLWAPETSGITSGGAAPMFGTGKGRGHLPTAILNHKFSKNIDGMLQFEYFVPGKFYSDAADDAIFFRWQLQFKI